LKVVVWFLGMAQGPKNTRGPVSKSIFIALDNDFAASRKHWDG